ncbi:type 1 glutamine amidotransferase domain-containing protein [Colwelliaceae bacterium 6471]
MKKLITGILLAAFFISTQSFAETRVALLISGYGSEGDTNISYDLEELAQTYLVLNDNGIELDIISPKGGAVHVHNKKDVLPYIQQFKQKTPALKQLMNTLSAKQAQNNEYDALMIIGGNGAMFDLPVHTETQTFIQQFVTQQAPIVAVCHGPAALINVKLENGDFFLKGKRVNSFTVKEEHAFKAELIDKYPFMLEPTLKERGAKFVSNLPMLPYLAEDGLLITAQNPMSVAKAADALLVKLGKTPKARTLFKDEATMQLISQARIEGAYLIDLALATSKDNYNLQYLALYGFYAYKLAETQAHKLIELRIMERIGEHFSHPNYSEALAKAYLEQGFDEKAKTEVKALKNNFPTFEISEDLIKL